MNKVLLLKCLPMSSGLKFKAFVMVGVLALTQSGCVDIPELDNGISKDLRHADYPKLLPIETALGPELVPTQNAEDIDAELQARLARLNQRADTLRKPILNADARSRLEETVGE